MNIRNTRHFFSVISVLLFFGTTQAQHKDSLLSWQGSGKLQLSDFKHPVDSAAIKGGSLYMASSLLDLKWSIPEFLKYDTVFTYEVKAVFYKYLSWIYDPAKLDHERLHFDIAEIYARRMRRALHTMPIDYESYNMVSRKLNDIYNEHAKYHALYDKETHSGKLKNLQLRWERNIATQLDTLSAYSSPTGRARMVRIVR